MHGDWLSFIPASARHNNWRDVGKMLINFTDGLLTVFTVNPTSFRGKVAAVRIHHRTIAVK